MHISTRQHIFEAGLSLGWARHLFLQVVLGVCLLSSFSLYHAQAAPLRIAVVLSEGSGAYQEFFSQLKTNVSSKYALNVFAVGEPVRDVDLVIAVGMKAATALASTALPVLNVFVPRAGFEALPNSYSSKHTAIFMDQPMERQLELLVSVLPGATEIGVLYAAPPAELGALKRLLAGRRMVLHERAVDQTHPLASALSALLGSSEVLFVLPDMAVYNSETIRNILLETYRRQVPMIGISQSYVRAGALCAVYSTPQQFAQQTIQAMEQFAASGKLPSNQYSVDFDVSVNTQVARSLGLNIKDAEQLRTSIKRKQ